MELSHRSRAGEGVTGRFRRPGPAGLTVALLVVVLLSACGNGDDGVSAAPTPSLPDWIVKLEPGPGQPTSALRRVEVHHKVLTGGENVRLSIDGTDVTAYSQFGRPDNFGGPGTIVYDFEQSRDFVPLDPGPHTATVELVKPTGIGEMYDVLDSYSWEFRIQ